MWNISLIAEGGLEMSYLLLGIYVFFSFLHCSTPYDLLDRVTFLTKFKDESMLLRSEFISPLQFVLYVFKFSLLMPFNW